VTGVDALTGSERRVARLAAAGITNREIAQSLFVTTRTIEIHLSAAYRKIGIDSRRDLHEASPKLDRSTISSTSPALAPRLRGILSRRVVRPDGGLRGPSAQHGSPQVGANRHLIGRAVRLSPSDASVADPTSPAAATTTYGEHEDHDSSGDDCDSDPENGSAKNSLHDRHPSVWGCVPNRSGHNLHQ